MTRALLSALALVGLACTASQNTTNDTTTDSKPPDTKAPEPKPGSRMCTEMACSDAATIDTKLTAAGAPLGKHEFTIEVDGAAQGCTVDFAVATQIAHGTCSGTATLWLGPEMRSIEEAMGDVVGVRIEPIPGAFAWQLVLLGTPAKAHVVHTHAGKVLFDQTAEFTNYVEHRPNGEGCEPVCKAAGVSWKGP